MANESDENIDWEAKEPLNRGDKKRFPFFHFKLIFVPPEKTNDNESSRDRISFQFISSQVNRHNPIDTIGNIHSSNTNTFSGL